MEGHVMHFEMKNPNFSLCKRSSYTSHIITTKDKNEVTCLKCLSLLNKKSKAKETKERKHDITYFMEKLTTGTMTPEDRREYNELLAKQLYMI